MMHLNSFVRLLACHALLIVLPGGCGHREAKEGHHEPSHVETGHHEEGDPKEGVSFHPKSGLFIPPETAKFIALRVEDVTEHRVQSTLQFSAQVYRTASEAQFASLTPAVSRTALASGQVNRSEAEALRPGQVVTVQTPDGRSRDARVAEMPSTLSTNTSRVEVILAIQDEPEPLRPGTFVSATSKTGNETPVVAVPKSALLRTAEGTFVYTVSGERFVRAPVRLGVINHEFAEVTDGLYAGDQIVVRPVLTLWLAELQSIRGGKACADGH